MPFRTRNSVIYAWTRMCALRPSVVLSFRGSHFRGPFNNFPPRSPTQPAPLRKPIFFKGASIYDVCTGGERGVQEKAEQVREAIKGGCVKMRTRGVSGKITKNCGRHKWMVWRPLRPMTERRDVTGNERPSERDSELPLRPTVIKRGRDQILHGGGGGVGGPEFMCFGPKASCAFIF